MSSDNAASFNLDDKLHALEEYLRAGGVPEQTVITNISNLRRLLGFVKSILDPGPEETGEQALARMELICRNLFEGMDNRWTFRKFDILDVLRAKSRTAIMKLYSALVVDGEPGEAERFSSAMNLANQA